MRDEFEDIEKYYEKLDRIVAEGVGKQRNRIRFLTICTDVSYKKFISGHLTLAKKIEEVGDLFAERDACFRAVMYGAITELKAQFKSASDELPIRSTHARSWWSWWIRKRSATTC